jgi:cytochrome b561
MRRAVPRERYNAVAIVLHWTMAAGIVTLIGMGLVMAHAKLPPARLFSLYQLHKSIGITILLAAGLRLAWRFTHRPPALPDDMPAVERAAATGAHWLLYLMLFALPLSGWALVSASPLGIPTVLYGLVSWPHLPMFANLADKVSAERTITFVHAWGAYALTAMIVLHAGAALRHQLVLRDRVLSRILPARRQRRVDQFEELRP